MKKKPTIFSKKLNKYPDGGTTGDPLKWNHFQLWAKQQKSPTGELYVGNPKMDTNYEGGDKIDPNTVINQWNTANPNQQINQADIEAAQKYSGGKLKTDKWYGSQTSQYLYPAGTAFTFPTNSTEGQTQDTKYKIGDKEYPATYTYTGGKAKLSKLNNIPIFAFGGDFQKGLHNALDKTGDFLDNTARGTADVALSTLGMNNVIQDQDYTGTGANFTKNTANTAGNITKQLAPLAANMILPGSGQFVQMGQNMLGKFNPEQQNQQFGNGGIQEGQPNAEVEKQEVIKMPNGQVEQVNGPTHEQGGVQVNIPNGTDIFSDRLKHPELKKTFAKLAAKYKTDKETKILEDPKSNTNSRNSAQLNLLAKNSILDKLFQEQESLKQDKVLNYAKKMGLREPSYDQDFNYENYDKENDHGRLINPDNKNLKQHKFGGTSKFPKYDNGGEYKNLNQNGLPTLDETGLETQPNFHKVQNNPNQNSFKLPDLSNSQKDALGYGIGAVAQNIGNLAYLKEQGKNYDTQNFYNFNPSLIDDKQALNQADIEGKVANQNIISASGGNSGQYLSNRVALASSLARAKAGIMENTANINAQIKNQGEQYNIQNKYMTDDVNAQNKGKALSNYYNTLNTLGNSVAGANKDYRATQQDRQMINLLPELYKNPEFAQLLKKYGYTK